MSKLPALFICQGDREHLKFSLLQARISNEAGGVILLGDRSTESLHNIAHFNLFDFYRSASRFARHYKHLSSNNHFVELFCFQRWFVLLDFMIQHSLDRVFHLDTDVLLYDDLESTCRDFQNTDFTFQKMTSGHSCLVNSVQALQKLCDFMLNYYVDSKKLHSLESKFQEHLKGGGVGGISDMYLLKLFSESRAARIADGTEIVNGAVFDHNIGFGDGYLVSGGMKTIIWRDGKPYGLKLDTQKLVRFRTLHFQGNAKEWMPRFLSANI